MEEKNFLCDIFIWKVILQKVILFMLSDETSLSSMSA